MRSCWTLLFLLLLWTGPAVAGEPLEFLTDSNHPFSYDEHGHIAGKAVDAVRRICVRAGCEPQFTLAPWPWVLEGMRVGKGDAVFTAIKTPERERFLLYADEPLGMARNVLLACSSSAPTVSRLEDLTGSMVGVIKGYAYPREFATTASFARDESPNAMTMLRKCLGQRLDYVVLTEALRQRLPELLPEAAALAVQPFVLEWFPFYIAFSRAHGEKATRWAAAISQAIHELRQEGQLPPLPSVP